MHQTFYIDIDEEITSIVDRLRKSKANEIVIVVPKRALLIQSIVNLKLLKKEAENLKRQIMIVTQDKLGKLLIEKAGILVQQKLDEALEDVLVFEDENKEKEKTEIEEKKRKNKNGKGREIGSSDYFSADAHNEELVLSEKKSVESEEKKDFERITNKELVTGISKEIKRGKGIFGRNKKSVSMDMTKNMKIREESYSPEDEMNNSNEGDSKKTSPRHFGGEKVGKKLEKFFLEKHDVKEEKPIRMPGEKLPKINLSGKFHKFFLFFGILAVAAIALVGSYLYFPKASIKLFVKNKTETLDLEIKGSKSAGQVDFEKGIVPAKEIFIQEEDTQNFDSSGAKSISNQKARGKITIYNEYSSSSQPLVATTRFLSENGKLFRLSGGVTVPGTTKDGDSVKPGTVEAEVVADEPGEEFNIGPTSFTIPGFKDSGAEKYAKFYAKSTETMTGGGNGNEEMKVITQGDIDSAKSKVLTAVNSKIKESLKRESGEGMTIFDDAIVYEEAEYLISNSVGEVSNSFSLTVRSGAKTLAVREDDLKDLAGQKAVGKENASDMKNNSVVLEFGKTDTDFAVGELLLRTHAVVKIGPKIDLENLKRGSLGKNEEELGAYLSSYKYIEKVSVDYWPPFITGKIPLYEKRVDVSLDNI